MPINGLHPHVDYFDWYFVKTKVNEERSGKPFASEAELKKKKICLEYLFGISLYMCLFSSLSQREFTCSKLTIETLEQGVKYVQSVSSVSIVNLEHVIADWVVKTNLFYIVDHLKDNFIQQIYQMFSFLTSILTFSHRHIFETLLKNLYISANFFNIDFKLSK